MNILIYQFCDKERLCKAFIRLQEFAEGEFKGKPFSREEVLNHYNDKYNIDYYTEWDGFNIPGEDITKFNEMFSDKSEDEELIIKAAALMGSDCYVIGTFGETYAHELHHAFYHDDYEYRSQIDFQLRCFDTEEFKRLLLEDFGYNENEVKDEIAAYCIGSLQELVEGGVNVLKHLNMILNLLQVFQSKLVKEYMTKSCIVREVL